MESNLSDRQAVDPDQLSLLVQSDASQVSQFSARATTLERRARAVKDLAFYVCSLDAIRDFNGPYAIDKKADDLINQITSQLEVKVEALEISDPVKFKTFINSFYFLH